MRVIPIVRGIRGVWIFGCVMSRLTSHNKARATEGLRCSTSLVEQIAEEVMKRFVGNVGRWRSE